MDELEEDRSEDDDATDDVTGAEKFARDAWQQPTNRNDHADDEIIQEPSTLRMQDMHEAAVVREKANTQQSNCRNRQHDPHCDQPPIIFAMRHQWHEEIIHQRDPQQGRHSDGEIKLPRIQSLVRAKKTDVMLPPLARTVRHNRANDAANEGRKKQGCDEGG